MPGSEKVFPIATLRWSMISLLALIVSILTVVCWERQLVGYEKAGPFRIMTYAATGRNWQADDERIYWKRTEDKGVIKVEYGFVTLHDDQAYLNLSVGAGQYKGYQDNFGYLQSEMDDLFKKQQENLAAAYKEALRTHPPPDRLQEKYARIKKEYYDGVENLVRSRGLRYLSKSVLAADVPGIVRKNVKNLRRVAESIAHLVRSLG